MAQGFDFDYSVTDEQKAHFNKLREDRGWTWELLAEDFERQETDPASAGLVAWARSQGKSGAKSARGGADKVEKR